MQNDEFLTKFNLVFFNCDHLLLISLLTIMCHPLKKSRALIHGGKKKAIKKVSLLNLT